MKEVLTKRFWQGVKSTFYEALEDRAPENTGPRISDAGAPKVTSTSDTPAPLPNSSDPR